MKMKYIILIIFLAILAFGIYCWITKAKEGSKSNYISNEEISVGSEIGSQVKEEDQQLPSDQETPKEAESVTPEEKVTVSTPEPAVKKPATENVDVKKPSQDENGGSSAGKIVQKLITWGYQKATDRKIDTIIIHSSYDAIGSDPYSISGIIDEYKQAQVSAHYLIGRDGTIYQLVADQNIAWHAGVSTMPDGRTNVNSFSIGIEMVNTKDGKFTSDQYDAVNSLIASLKKKYSIKYVLGHEDIAPGRKTDPWNMDWKKINK